ncbi:PAS domain S-box protein, partial [bacterium]|nr:PAS domain S-box protein [bacterium]
MPKVKILVVEDERIVAKDIQNRLESLGYSVAGIASTGEEAIQTALRTDPDLILMDILLKGSVDGIQATEEITRKLGVPVVYLTAYADEITLQRAKITGPFGYIVKPYEQKGLHTTIETALFKHKLEKKLKESEERYRTLQENLPLGVFRVTPDGRIISVNPTMVTIFGYDTEEDMLDRTVNDLYAVAEHRRALRRRLKAEGVVTNYEVRLVRKNGEEFWASLNVRAIRDDAGSILYHDGTLRDVTEQKRTEELKKEYFRNLTFLSKTAMDFVAGESGENIYSYVAEKIKGIVSGSQIVAVISLDEGTNNYHIRSIVGLGKRLQTILSLLGRDPVGMSMPLTAEIKNLMKKGKLRRISADFNRHSGGTISKGVSQTLRKILQMGLIYLMGILKGDKLLGSVVVVMQKGCSLTNRDVVEAFINQAAVALLRGRAEEAKLASEQRYYELFHHMQNGLIVLEAIEDGSDFIIKEFNKAGEKISKIDRELVIGEMVTEVFPGVVKPGLVEVFKKVWKTGKPEYVPAWFYKDARLSGWRESHIYRLPSGEIVNMYRDVTNRIQAQEALRNSEERYRSVVETSKDAIVTIDDEGMICFWNRAAERMFGYGG